MILLILTAIALLLAIALIVRGRKEAKFNAELKRLIWKIREYPLEQYFFKKIQSEFKRIGKLPGRDKERIQVAWVEFARRFIEFFDPGDEAEIKNVE